MYSSLYSSAAKGDIEVLRTYKDEILTQVTFPTNNTVLHIIAQHNDSSDAVKEVLSDQDSRSLFTLLTWKNSEGETALYIASRNRREGIVRELLTSFKELSSDIEYVNGDIIVEGVVRMGNKNGDTPLHEAVNNKDEVIVELLVKADPKCKHLPNNMGRTPLYVALEKRVSDQCFTRFIPDFLLYKVVTTYDPVLKAIFEFCESPGIEGPNGETVLHAAAKRERTSGWIGKICEIFPNITKKQDNQGFSPLHYAASFDNYQGAEYLLKADKLMAYMTAAEDKHDSMTPLHIAATKGHSKVIATILNIRGDCWDGLTSKGQNILHLAAQGQHKKCIIFIMQQPWAINLLNMKDNDGNTPSHLLLSSMPKHYKIFEPLLEHPNVYVDSFNNQHSTHLQVFDKAEIRFTAKKVNILNKLKTKFGKVETFPWIIDDGMKGNSEKEVNKTQRLEEMKKTSETHLLVAALIATVTFAAGFTLPGGYDGDEGPNQGMAILLRKAAFKAFILTDTIGFISSCVAIFLHFTATLYKQDEEKISNRYSAALLFLVIAMISMAITFMTGLYVVLEKSPEIARTVWIIGCCGILYLLYLIRKVYRDMGFIIDEYVLATILLVVPTFLWVVFLGCLYVFLLPYRGCLYVAKYVKRCFIKVGDILKGILM